MPSTRKSSNAAASAANGSPPPTHNAAAPIYSAVLHGAAQAAIPTERVQAGFSLRLCSANVCVFPIATRNKYAPVQAAVAIVTTALALKAIFNAYWPFIALWQQCFLIFLLTFPLMAIVLPLETLVLLILTRGSWHDHKRARLQLLINELDSFDCIALQELFSSALDSRYRDFVLREAAARGLHYSVSCPRLPELPSVMLNAGTMILSRYPIVDQRNIVFRSRAAFDVITVNRGAAWARISLPTNHTLHFFTCHIAPPLNEVSERLGSAIVSRMQCAQRAQLQELVAFVKECIKPDVDAWERTKNANAAATDDAASGRSLLSPASALSPSSPPPSRPFSVVLAGDFNMDAGSSRYFELLSALHALDLGIEDIFATSPEEQGEHYWESQTAASGAAAEKEAAPMPHGDDSDEECIPAATASARKRSRAKRGRAGSNTASSDEAAAAATAAAANLSAFPSGSPSSSPSFQPSSIASSLASLPALSALPSAVPSAARSRSAGAAAAAAPARGKKLFVARNVWDVTRGNGRECFDPALHSAHVARAAIAKQPHAAQHHSHHAHHHHAHGSKPKLHAHCLHWPATFGQVLSPSPPPRVAIDGGSASGSSSVPARVSPSPPACTPRCRHQETFLTHPSLLGSHSTHDFVFSSLLPRSTAVEPFMAPHALARLDRNAEDEEHDDEESETEEAEEEEAAQRHESAVPGSGGSRNRRRVSSSAAAATSAASSMLRLLPSDSALDGYDSDGGCRVPPPFSQLSDHCALLATLMMPSEALSRSRAASAAHAAHS